MINLLIEDFRWVFVPLYAFIFFMLLIMLREVIKFVAFIFGIKIGKKAK
jgi:hypothetical protein